MVIIAMLLGIPAIFLGCYMYVKLQASFGVIDQVSLYKDEVMLSVLWLILICILVVRKGKEHNHAGKKYFILSVITLLTIYASCIVTNMFSGLSSESGMVLNIVLKVSQIGMIMFAVVLIKPNFEHVKQVAAKKIILVLLELVLLSIVIIFIVLPAVKSGMFGILQLQDATYGLINYDLIIELSYLILILFSLKAIDRISIHDLGLERNSFVIGLKATIIIWFYYQITNLFVNWLSNRDIVWSFEGNEVGILEWIGNYLSFFFAVGLSEEMVFRGFLFVQIYLLLSRRLSGSQSRSACIALVITQSFFSLSHFRPLFLSGKGIDESIYFFLQLVAAGMFFVFVYAWTKSLFVAVGMHALIDYHLNLFVSENIITFDSAFLVYAYCLVFLMIWPLITQGKKGFSRWIFKTRQKESFFVHRERG